MLSNIVYKTLTTSSRAHFSSTVQRVGIVGAGQMGTGIGIVAARVANCHVAFVEPKEAG